MSNEASVTRLHSCGPRLWEVLLTKGAGARFYVLVESASAFDALMSISPLMDRGGKLDGTVVEGISLREEVLYYLPKLSFPNDPILRTPRVGDIVSTRMTITKMDPFSDGWWVTGEVFPGGPKQSWPAWMVRIEQEGD